VCVVVTVSARGATNDGNAATPQSTIMNGAPLMTPPVMPLAYQQQPLIPVGPAAAFQHHPYTQVCMNCSSAVCLALLMSNVLPDL